MTINDNSTKSINAAIIDLQNQIKQLQHKIGILSKNQLKEDDIEFPGKVEYADEAGKAKEADHAKTADTAKYTSETENAVHAGYADIATKATQDGSGNVITDTYATKTELTSGLSGKANTSHNHSAADITSGTLAVARGGTGQTTQADINKAFVGGLEEETSDVTDGTMFVSSWASDNGFADTNAVNVPYKRKFSRVWEYIKGKISSVLGITNNKHIIQGKTVDTNTYADTNPKLVFSNPDGSQGASLTFTDYDLVQAPASVTLNGNQGGEYFIAPNIKATDKFYGNLSGKADTAGTADKATKDASGNVITSTYLPLSGGAMTGDIQYKGSKSTEKMIRFIDNKNDTYGNGIAIGGGGATIIGGGESSIVVAEQQTSGGDEKMIVSNGQEIDFYMNCQDGFASAKHITMNTDGTITAAGFNGTATKATQDGNGNVITSTYVKKGEVGVPQVVHFNTSNLAGSYELVHFGFRSAFRCVISGTCANYAEAKIIDVIASSAANPQSNTLGNTSIGSQGNFSFGGGDWMGSTMYWNKPPTEKYVYYTVVFIPYSENNVYLLI